MRTPEQYTSLHARIAMESDRASRISDAHLSSLLIEASSAIESLRAEVAALRADAERYRWLRDSDHAYGVFGPATAETMDAEVDEAMLNWPTPPAQPQEQT